MYIVGNNCAGISNKKDSLTNMIDKFCPGVLMLQETKCKKKNTVKLDEYTVFEHLRNESSGGGLLTAVHSSLHPVCVGDGGEVEVLVVEANLGSRKVHFINAYGKQGARKRYIHYPG